MSGLLSFKNKRMKSFNVPVNYRSPLISSIKKKRKQEDKLKKDFTPTCIDLGNLQIFLARHFGFCYGVENAIEIAFRTIDENPGKRIFLLSEMIHNPLVNKDLTDRGVQFLQDTSGKNIIPFESLTSDDVVIIPAWLPVKDLASCPRFAIAIASNAIEIRSPAVSNISSSRPFGRGDT